jgi:hypothetical protein
MSVEIISIQGLWPIFSRVPWLAALVARRYFTANRLAGLVYVDLYPRHQSARIDVGPVATFDFHLQLINLSPFELTMEQANFHFYSGGVKLDAIVLKKEQISPGASMSLFLSGSLGDGQADQIAKFHNQHQAYLDGNIEFKCLVRSFPKQIMNLSGIQTVIINENHRNPTA